MGPVESAANDTAGGDTEQRAVAIRLLRIMRIGHTGSAATKTCPRETPIVSTNATNCQLADASLGWRRRLGSEPIADKADGERDNGVISLDEDSAGSEPRLLATANVVR